MPHVTQQAETGGEPTQPIVTTQAATIITEIGAT
jgi:hypothetical protein